MLRKAAGNNGTRVPAETITTVAEEELHGFTRTLKIAKKLFPSAIETGAKPVSSVTIRRRRVRRCDEIPAVLGAVPDDSTQESYSSKSRHIFDKSTPDTHAVILSGSTPDSPGPTVRNHTRPNQVTAGSRDLERRPVINWSIKLSVPIH